MSHPLFPTTLLSLRSVTLSLPLLEAMWWDSFLPPCFLATVLQNCIHGSFRAKMDGNGETAVLVTAFTVVHTTMSIEAQRDSCISHAHAHIHYA